MKLYKQPDGSWCDERGATSRTGDSVETTLSGIVVRSGGGDLDGKSWETEVEVPWSLIDLIRVKL